MVPPILVLSLLIWYFWILSHGYLLFIHRPILFHEWSIFFPTIINFLLLLSIVSKINKTKWVMRFLFYLYVFNRRRRKKRPSHHLWISSASIAWTMAPCMQRLSSQRKRCNGSNFTYEGSRSRHPNDRKCDINANRGLLFIVVKSK